MQYSLGPRQMTVYTTAKATLYASDVCDLIDLLEIIDSHIHTL